MLFVSAQQKQNMRLISFKVFVCVCVCMCVCVCVCACVCVEVEVGRAGRLPSPRCPLHPTVFLICVCVCVGRVVISVHVCVPKLLMPLRLRGTDASWAKPAHCLHPHPHPPMGTQLFA